MSQGLIDQLITLNRRQRSRNIPVLLQVFTQRIVQ